MASVWNCRLQHSGVSAGLQYTVNNSRELWYGLYYLVETPDDEDGLLLVELDLLSGGREGSVKPLLERVARLNMYIDFSPSLRVKYLSLLISERACYRGET